MMKRKLGIGRCRLACCLCFENTTFNGCNSGYCPDNDWCETENVLWKKELHTIMNVRKIVKRAY